MVKVEGIRGAVCEALRLVGIKKKDVVLFEDEIPIPSLPTDLRVEDCTQDDVGYIFELLRYM